MTEPRRNEAQEQTLRGRFVVDAGLTIRSGFSRCYGEQLNIVAAEHGLDEIPIPEDWGAVPDSPIVRSWMQQLAPAVRAFQKLLDPEWKPGGLGIGKDLALSFHRMAITGLDAKFRSVRGLEPATMEDKLEAIRSHISTPAKDAPREMGEDREEWFQK